LGVTVTAVASLLATVRESRVPVAVGLSAWFLYIQLQWGDVQEGMFGATSKNSPVVAKSKL
jgi:hypothetical protein